MRDLARLEEGPLPLRVDFRSGGPSREEDFGLRLLELFSPAGCPARSSSHPRIERTLDLGVGIDAAGTNGRRVYLLHDGGLGGPCAVSIPGSTGAPSQAHIFP